MRLDGQILEMHRFFSACWPEQSARYRARWAEEARLASEAFFRSGVKGGHAGPSSAFEAATWHGVLELLHEVHRAMGKPSPPPTSETLTLFAQAWQELAEEIEEPMPQEIEWFIREHGPRAG